MPDPITTALQQVPDEPLSKDFTIPPFSKSIVKSPEVKIGNIPLDLSFTATATVDVDLFNSAGDKDPNGVFAGSSGDPAPPIPFAQQRAWLKYSLKGALRGELGADFGMVGVAVKAGREIAFFDYRMHDASINARAALARDLVDPRSILDLDHVRRLNPGEALSMQIEGSLTAVVKFSWADAFSSAATELTKFLNSSAPIAIKLSAGLTASIGLEITDDFVFVVSRTTDERFRISVKKAKSRGLDVGVGVSLGAEFENSKTVQTALEALVEGAIGQPLQVVDDLLKKVQSAPASLNEIEQRIFAELVERLHVKTALDRVQAVRDEIANLEKRLADAIKAVATAKATIGFKYEYARISEEEVLLDFLLLRDDELETAYPLALRGEVGALAQKTIDDETAYRLLQYFNEKTVTRKSAFGFTLGFGKHVLSTSDSKSITMRTREDIRGRKMIAFEGARGYAEKGVPNPDFTWSVDLKAQMEAFSARPMTDQFDFGLHLQLDFPRVRKNDAEKMADFGAMWGAVDSDAAAAEEEIKTFVAAGNGTAMLQLVFDEASLSATLANLRADDFGGFGDAFGAAMPYVDMFVTRRDHVRRRQTYGPLWAAHFAASFNDLSLTNWRNRMKHAIQEGGLRLVESSSPMAWTLPSIVVTLNPNVRTHRTTFADGAIRLRNAIANANSPEVIAKAFTSMSALWSQRQFVVAVGVYFVELARKAGILGGVTRSLTIRRGEDALVLSSQA